MLMEHTNGTANYFEQYEQYKSDSNVILINDKLAKITQLHRYNGIDNHTTCGS